LTVAVLVVFVIVLTLTAFFWLLLTGLTALLAALPSLSGLSRLLVLSGLSTLLALCGLATLLALLFHIVCHEYLLIRREPSRAFENLLTSET
jgi:hypothetical protein